MIAFRRQELKKPKPSEPFLMPSKRRLKLAILWKAAINV